MSWCQTAICTIFLARPYPAQHSNGDYKCRVKDKHGIADTHTGSPVLLQLGSSLGIRVNMVQDFFSLAWACLNSSSKSHAAAFRGFSSYSSSTSLLPSVNTKQTILLSVKMWNLKILINIKPVLSTTHMGDKTHWLCYHNFCWENTTVKFIFLQGFILAFIRKIVNSWIQNLATIFVEENVLMGFNWTSEKNQKLRKKCSQK